MGGPHDNSKAIRYQAIFRNTVECHRCIVHSRTKIISLKTQQQFTHFCIRSRSEVSTFFLKIAFRPTIKPQSSSLIKTPLNLTDGVLEMNLSTFTLTCFCCLIGASAHQYPGRYSYCHFVWKEVRKQYHVCHFRLRQLLS